MPHKSAQKLWSLYILRCRDGTLYTGITNDLTARLAAHAAGAGAKYTRGRGPLTLVHTETFDTRALASSREYAVKQLSRGEKLALISSDDVTAKI